MQSTVASKHARLPCAARRPHRSLTLNVSCAAGKTAFITGGNTGIGFETAKSLCQQGYSVTIACRDDSRAQAAVERIREAVPSAQIQSERLDLSDLASVRDCAKRVADSGVQYDVWLNNAGVMYCPKMSTKDGFEYQLGVNHLGHFALTNEVLPVLQASGKPVRIINVASAAHLFGQINFGDLMRDAKYDPWDAYGQSKLANIMFTYELVRRLGGGSKITANCLHPGVVKTELGRYMLDESKGSWFGGLAIEAFKLFMKTPEQGAETNIYLASSPDVEGVTGKYYMDCRRATSGVQSYDREVAAKLWDVSLELTAPKAKAMAASSAAAAAAVSA